MTDFDTELQQQLKGIYLQNPSQRGTLSQTGRKAAKAQNDPTTSHR
jgi:hypothetical protein